MSMYHLYIDTVEIPAEIEIEIANFVAFNRKEFIEQAKKYAEVNPQLSSAAYVVSSNAKDTLFSTEPDTGYHSFMLTIELTPENIFDAIDEAITIASKLKVNCFEVMEKSSSISFIYLHDAKWHSLVSNENYKIEVNNYLKNK